MISRRLLLGIALGAGCCTGHALRTCFAQDDQTPPAASAAVPAAPAAAAVPSVALPPPISDTLKHSTSVAPKDPTLTAAIGAVAQAMADGSNPAGQSAARDWLVQNLVDSEGGLASQAYQYQYAAIIDEQLRRVIDHPVKGVPVLRLKIEAGLAAQEITQRTQNYALSQLVVTLAKDKSSPVALVGIQAAGQIIPILLTNPRANNYTVSLCDQIISDVKTFSDGPLAPIISNDGYVAIYGASFGHNVPLSQIVQVIIPALLDLEDARAAIYTKMKPANPLADADGLVTLLSLNFWSNNDPGALVFSPKMQVRVLQTVSNLTALTAHWAEATPLGPDRTELINALKKIGATLMTFSNPNNGAVPDQSLNNAASALGQLGPATLAEEITTAEFNLRAQLKTFAQSRDPNAVIAEPPQVASAP